VSRKPWTREEIALLYREATEDGLGAAAFFARLKRAYPVDFARLASKYGVPENQADSDTIIVTSLPPPNYGYAQGNKTRVLAAGDIPPIPLPPPAVGDFSGPPKRRKDRSNGKRHDHKDAVLRRSKKRPAG